MSQPLILATGFSVFPGAPENPTAWAMEQLTASGWQPEGARLVTRVLPVRYDIWDAELGPLLAQAKPAAVVAFGLSAKARGVTLESTARNKLALERPDAVGKHPSGERIIESGEEIFPSRLPLRDITIALRRADVPVEPSDDAGDYLCNMLFYRLMAQAEATGTPRAGGFVHVPYLDTQLTRLAAGGMPTADMFALTETQLMDGVRAVLTATAQQIFAMRPPR